MVLEPGKKLSGEKGEAVYIGIGSNLDPENNIRRSIPEIQSRMEIVSTSRFYRNPAYVPGDVPEPQPSFINGVLWVRTPMDPWDLKFRVLREIEQRAGRTRGVGRFAPRTLDTDLLLYDDLRVETPSLVLPDPDIFVRSFWTVPLAELLPNLPVPGETPVTLKQIAAKMDTGSLVFMEALTADVRRMLRERSR